MKGGLGKDISASPLKYSTPQRWYCSIVAVKLVPGPGVLYPILFVNFELYGLALTTYSSSYSLIGQFSLRSFRLRD